MGAITLERLRDKVVISIPTGLAATPPETLPLTVVPSTRTAAKPKKGTNLTEPFDVNTASPALLEAMGLSRSEVGTVLALRVAHPFRNMTEVTKLGTSGQRLGLGGNLIWTLRATARLRRPDGMPSETVRSAAAVVKLVPRDRYFQAPVHILRYYDDAWSEFAVTPPMGAVSR